jgi:hypothetical protein
MIQLRNPSTVLIGKSFKEIGLFEKLERKYNLFFRPTNAQHIYININIFVCTAACFSASASSSGSLKLVLTKVTKLLKLLKLQLNIKINKHLTTVAKILISYLSGSQSVLRRPQGSATSSQGIHGYISVMPNKKFT